MSNPFDRDRDRDLGAQGTELKAGGTMDRGIGKAQEVAGDLTGNEE